MVVSPARPPRLRLSLPGPVWLLPALVVGVACGVASTAFLAVLEAATRFRLTHEVVVFALPVAGLLLGAAYERLGPALHAGTSRVFAALDGGPTLPARLAPMVLLGTVFTHLFGGSAGREGTAVQMGAGLADSVAGACGLSGATRLRLLVAGLAGGFASVFGTPVAGVVFALEAPRAAGASVPSGALLPAALAAWAGHHTAEALGVVHLHYPTFQESVPLSGVLGWLGLAVGAGAVAWVFVRATHSVREVAARRFPRLAPRLFVGGALIVLLWQGLAPLGVGSDPLGLGLPLITSAFDGTRPAYTFAVKLLFTVVTIGFGFIGGEVTPLFVIGAAFGALVAEPLGLPLVPAVGVALVGVFAAASKCKWALTVMAVELFGWHAALPAGLVCLVGARLSGREGLYR